MKRLTILIIIAGMVTSISGLSPEKAIMKSAKQYWKQEIVIEEIIPGDFAGEDYTDKDRIFFVMSKSEAEIIGYCLSTSARGRYEDFDYLILYNPDLVVSNVVIWQYRSTYGGAVAGKRWLRQFSGYNGEKLSYGKEIQAISGATISGHSIVSDIQRVHRMMNQLKTMNYL